MENVSSDLDTKGTPPSLTANDLADHRSLNYGPQPSSWPGVTKGGARVTCRTIGWMRWWPSHCPDCSRARKLEGHIRTQNTHDSPPDDWGFSRTHTAAVASVPVKSWAQDQGQWKDAGCKVTGTPPLLRGPLGTRAAAGCGQEPRWHGPSWSPRPRPTEVSPEGTQVAAGLDGPGRPPPGAPSCNVELGLQAQVSEIVAEVLGSRGPARLSPRGSLGSPGRAGCRKSHVSLPATPASGVLPVALQRSEVFGTCDRPPAPAS